MPAYREACGRPGLRTLLTRPAVLRTSLHIHTCAVAYPPLSWLRVWVCVRHHLQAYTTAKTLERWGAVMTVGLLLAMGGVVAFTDQACGQSPTLQAMFAMAALSGVATLVGKSMVPFFEYRDYIHAEK